MEEKTNDLNERITQALNEMKSELGDKFDLERINLAELERRSDISRGKLRRIQAAGFIDKPHGLIGRKAATTVLTGFTGIIDSLLRAGITNSSLCFDRLKENGYAGGLTAIKNYIAAHRDLVPAKRQTVSRNARRRHRYPFLHYEGRSPGRQAPAHDTRDRNEGIEEEHSTNGRIL